jgi:hypothetical protein
MLRGGAVEMPLPRHTLQRAHAAVFELQARVAHQILHRVGHHFAGLGVAGDARADVYRDAADLFANDFDFPGWAEPSSRRGQAAAQ